MRMYVANCTKQFYEFSYRVLEEGGLRQQRIPIGGQILIAGDLSTPQIDSIIKLNTRYGMIRAEDVKSAKPGAINLIYSIDQKIPLATIMQAMDINRRVLIARGQETRKQAAVSANNLIESHLEEANNIATLDNFEVTIEEEERKNATGDEGAPVNEAIRVSRSEIPNAPRPERAARKGSRRKAA